MARPAKPGAADALGHQQDDQDERAGQEHLEQERAAEVDRPVVVRVRAEAARVVRDAGLGHHQLDDGGTGDGAEELRDPVADRLVGGHPATEQHAKVTAGLT